MLDQGNFRAHTHPAPLQLRSPCLAYRRDEALNAACAMSDCDASFARSCLILRLHAADCSLEKTKPRSVQLLLHCN